jgi:hypothetical protein
LKIDTFFLKSYNHFKIIPIGLTMEQIEQYKPPHNPAQITDPRAKDYVKKFGQKSWEVDALDPDTMIEIVEDKILEAVEFFNSGEKTISTLPSVFSVQNTVDTLLSKI